MHPEDILLGEKVSANDFKTNGNPFYSIEAGKTHTAIFGIGGSGKTVTAKQLIREFVKQGVPVTITNRP